MKLDVLRKVGRRTDSDFHFVFADSGVSIEPLLGCLEATKLRATTKRDKARMALAQLARAFPLQGDGEPD